MSVPAADNLRIAIQSMWPDLHDDNEAHMTYAADQLERLTAWKAEATTVLNEWERTWEAAGRPGALGQSKAKAVADLLEAIDALHQPYYDTCPDSFTMGERFCICGSDDPWPCPTARLLHPPVPAEETLPNTEVRP